MRERKWRNVKISKIIYITLGFSVGLVVAAAFFHFLPFIFAGINYIFNN